VCCSVLQCVAVCCSVLQCVAVGCSVLQCKYMSLDANTMFTQKLSKPQNLAFYVLQVCCSVLQCGAVCPNVLQCAAVCGSVWQCAAETHTATQHTSFKSVISHKHESQHICEHLGHVKRTHCNSLQHTATHCNILYKFQECYQP